jgi:hypothetical protein
VTHVDDQASTLSSLVNPQDLDRRRGEEDLTKGVKELTRLLARPETSASELIELVQILKLKLELEGSSCEAPGEWDQEASAEPARSSRLDLLSNELHRSLTIHRQDVI